jgi:glycosyltransferase involved in cell wall biosynthesis
LFVLPSHQENLGVALVEAMAAGVPPIVTPGVNLGREIDAAQAGWLVPERQSVFVETLRTAMQTAGDRLARGDRARVFAQRFRWPVIGPQLVQLYDGLTRSVAPIARTPATAPSRRGPATIARH